MGGEAETWLGLQRRAKPLVQAGILLGVGLGGFFDGIVFHQILQWHHMATSHPDPTIAGDLSLNVMLDGVFHAVTYTVTVLGVVLLWRARWIPGVPTSGRALFGAVILGWGLFNVLEGVVDHQLLGIHHVWPAGPGPVLLWDAAFLGWGLLFIIGGYAIVRSDEAIAPDREMAQQIDQEESR